MAASLTLRSHYERRDLSRIDPEAIDWYGTFTLILEVPDPTSFPAGSHLVVWCAALLTPTDSSNASVVERVSGRVEFATLDHDPIATTGVWLIDGLRSRLPARHANDGPEAAHVIFPDGSTLAVEITPSTTDTRPRTDDREPQPQPEPSDSAPPIVPFPTGLRRVADADESLPARRALRATADRNAIRALDVRADTEAGRRVGEAIRSLAERLGSSAFDTSGKGRRADVHLRADAGLAVEAYRVSVGDDRIDLVAGSDEGLRHGLVTLAQWSESGIPVGATIDDRPALPARIVHLDVARRWYEPDVVERLIDLAAWRKLNRVHLHLTDDEAWRLPVPEYPALAAIAGTRGHGLPIGPLVASGPLPYGRAYTAEDIAVWVQHADALGVVLVPEVDVPGHCHAALTAVAHLRDPDDSSGARSIQGFVDNVLVPGHPATMPFLEAVFGSLAALFPNSPWLHIGGDEVPDDAWSGSPIVAGYADERGLTSTREIETAFHRELIDMIRSTTGRDVAMWEEAALSGLAPSGYAVAWTSGDAGRRLTEAGHDVVMAPAQAYYLDMSPDRHWETSGASWAGNVTLEQSCAFDPFAAIDASSPGNLVGVQGCLWSEHISSIDVLDSLVFPRLDAVAERGWNGTIVDGPGGLARRGAALPRFTTAR